MITSVGREKSD